MPDIKNDCNISLDELLSQINQQTSLKLLEEKGWKMKKLIEDFDNINLIEKYKNIDFNSIRLPSLIEFDFTDPERGLWEFYNYPKEILEKQGVVYRDPKLDVLDSAFVAIDFGSSSSVVAIDNEGTHELLRIGAKPENLIKSPTAEEFENPTVVQMKDYPSFLSAWQGQAYRPQTDWLSVSCAHEAREEFRYLKSSEISKYSSFILNLKQHALNSKNVDYRDQQEQPNKFSVSYLDLKDIDIADSLITVDQNLPFNPIELYAWFLGMNINWRKRGIILNYYMTFPVKYSKSVKEAILASFKRGIQRSFPESLVQDDIFRDRFSIEELASEPAAYAAAAVKAFNIQPTEEGVAYAVFDFGGGTTDFDFGLYRLATEDEMDKNYETVFEHFEPNGDEYLGGENLLENLAYKVFTDKANLEICRGKYNETKYTENKCEVGDVITFMQPPKANTFAGAELLISNTRVSITNTLVVIRKLREMWESGSFAKEASVDFELMNGREEKVKVNFTINNQELDDYLTQRIEDGVKGFFIAMKQAFAHKEANHIHIILAGNSSRSRWMSDIFGVDPNIIDKSEKNEPPKKFFDLVSSIFGEDHPHFEIHHPLLMDADHPERPTAKTGVALGLLDLCPGGTVHVINHAQNSSEDQENEAPFGYYVGRVRQGKLQHLAITKRSKYNEWSELTAVNRKVAFLYHTTSPKAETGDMVEGENELVKVRLQFTAEVNDGDKVFVRAKDPHTIEYCCAKSLDDVNAGNYYKASFKELSLRS